MASNSGQIYTVHEKLESPEPSERMELVREGFCFWAFAFTVFWLLFNRLWLASICYIALLGALGFATKTFGLNPLSMGMLQLLLQCLTGAHARDLLRLKLQHRGYRDAGVLVADSPLHAEQRYYAHAG